MYDKIIKNIQEKDWLVALILFIGWFVFCLSYSSTSPLWYDELFSLFWSQLKYEDVKSVSYWDVAPPGYHYIMHFWAKYLGISPLAARSLSCLASALACSLLYVFVKRRFNFKTAIVVTVLFVTNTPVFFYANEARCYSILLLLTIISGMLFVKLIYKPHIIWVIVIGIVNYYMFYSHFSSVFLIISQFIFALFYFKNNLLNWYLFSCGVLCYFLFPFLPRVIDLTMSNGQNHWVPKPTWEILKQYMSGFFNNSYFGWLILIMLLIGIYSHLKNKERKKLKPELIYFLLSGIGFILMSYVESLYKAPLFLNRYLLIAVIGVFIVFAYFIAQINFFKHSFVVITIILLVFGFSSLDKKIYKGMDLQRQMKVVKEHKTPSTGVITDIDLAVYYYDIDLFKHVYDLKNTLKEKNMFQAYDTTSLVDVDLTKYDKIILAATWPNTPGNFHNWLSKKYTKTEEISFENDGCKVFVYIKK